MLGKVGTHEWANGNNAAAAPFGVQDGGLDELGSDALSLACRRNFGMDEHEILSAEFVIEEGEPFFELQLEAELRLVVGDSRHPSLDAVRTISVCRDSFSVCPKRCR